MPAERASHASPFAERLIGDGDRRRSRCSAGGRWRATCRNSSCPDRWRSRAGCSNLFVTPDFLWNALTSTWRVLRLDCAALLIGGGLAFLAHGVPCLTAWSIERIKPVLNSFPSIGWAILAAIWFDPGNFGVIFVEIAILIPFCLINIAEGLRNIDRETHGDGAKLHAPPRAHSLAADTCRCWCPTGFRRPASPTASPGKSRWSRNCSARPSGLGYLMLRAQTAADSTTFLATCFAIVLIFVAGERLVIVPLERRFARR